MENTLAKLGILFEVANTMGKAYLREEFQRLFDKYKTQCANLHTVIELANGGNHGPIVQRENGFHNARSNGSEFMNEHKSLSNGKVETRNFLHTYRRKVGKMGIVILSVLFVMVWGLDIIGLHLPISARIILITLFLRFLFYVLQNCKCSGPLDTKVP